MKRYSPLDGEALETYQLENCRVRVYIEGDVYMCLQEYDAESEEWEDADRFPLATWDGSSADTDAYEAWLFSALEKIEKYGA